MRLSTRLSLAMATLVLATAAGVALVIDRNLESTLLPHALDRVETHARLIAFELENEVRNARADILSFRSAAALNGIIRARLNGGVHPSDKTSEAVWRRRMAERYAAELTSKPSYAQFRIIAVADGGREIVRVDRSGPHDAVRIVPDDELQRKGDRDYFQKTAALPPRGVYVSPIDLNQERGVIEIPHIPVLRVGTPIHAEDGALFGILIINVDLRAAFSRLQWSAAFGGRVYVVNDEGDFLLHPFPERQFGFQLGKRYRLQEEMPALTELLASEQTVGEIITDAGGNWLGAAIVPIWLADGPRISVIETASYAHLMAPVVAARQAVLTAVVAAIILAIGVAFLLARSLSRPLRQVTAAIESFGRDEPMALPTRAGGEIGVLALAFENMAAEVREKRQALETEFEERQQIFDTSLDLILVLDQQANFIAVSPSSKTVLGYEPDELVGRNASEYVHPEDLEAMREKMRRTRRGEPMHNFETRYVHKDGRVVTLTWTGVWSKPKQRHFFIGRDMTEQRLAEDKFRLAVEASPSGIIMVDTAGIVVLVNAEIEKLFGYDRDELIGQPVDMLVPLRFRAEHPKNRSSFTAHPRSRFMGAGRDLFGLRKDGTEFPVEVGLNPIHTKNGLLILSVVIDISERKENERLKGEFVATVSHELRTPLTSISGSLALLSAGGMRDLPPTAGRLVRIAHDNSQRLVRLINDILDIEKIESGKINLRFQCVAAKQFVQQAIEANRAFAEPLGVKIVLDPDAAEAAIRADPDRLNQVITNLLSNAAKFSPSGEEVTVTVAPHDDFVRIAVRDRGPGIPQDFKSRIFQKFAQADGTDARQKGGTGLGLSIVKQLINRMRGEVGFEAAPGGGTIFYVDLQRWDAATMVDPQEEASGTPVLLCEDDPDTAEFLCEHLRAAGFSPTVAYTAEEAIRGAALRSYAAVAVDLQLPDSDGITLIKQLRAQPDYHNTPIVVVSADPRRGRDDERAAALNVLDWLAKPVDIDHLLHVLQRPLARNGNERPRILHIDGDRRVLRAVAKALRPSADVVSVASVQGARRALKEENFDLAVLDVLLAEEFGLDLVPDLQDCNGHTIPVVIFSAQDTPEIAARVLAVLSQSRASVDGLIATLRKLVAAPPKRKAIQREVA